MIWIIASQLKIIPTHGCWMVWVKPNCPFINEFGVLMQTQARSQKGPTQSLSTWLGLSWISRSVQDLQPLLSPGSTSWSGPNLGPEQPEYLNQPLLIPLIGEQPKLIGYLNQPGSTYLIRIRVKSREVTNQVGYVFCLFCFFLEFLF